MAGVLGLAVSAAIAGPATAQEQPGGTAGVDRYLDKVRHDPVRLRAFLRDLPKGGDLHTHLSGAVSTESLIGYAADDDMCINTTTFVAAMPPCGPEQRPAQDAEKDPDFRAQVIGAWSMEGFKPGQGETGHDHFFATFGKFGAVTDRHRPQMLAEVVEKAAQQNESYMESMTTRQGGAVFQLSQRIDYDDDFARMREKLLADGEMARIVAAAKAEIDRDETQYRGLLRCGTPQASRGCDLTLRYIHQVGRLSEPKVVFAYMLYGFELAEAEGRYVALNLVQPEDGAVALRDYRLHMRMLDYLRGLYRRAHITLHAGELAPGLVPDAELRYHIREAVVTGHAERIGHGVDARYEDDWPGLMRLMAKRHVMVESPLTSNAQILGVEGRSHPFNTYRAFGVPIALATDDEGVSRSDLTTDYQRAVTSYRLRYGDLKKLARTALDHAFLDGSRLWRGPDDFRPAAACARDRLGTPNPSRACRGLLDGSAKARLQWRQEARFQTFERRYG
ncbi:adenosine deaminase [Actinomadura fulvescens]|uniref:adenosine deaminase n=1 Tax=Actinomadura fulvescens TaxID=46160 RepID=A0ABP6BVS6_9ACTN